MLTDYIGENSGLFVSFNGSSDNGCAPQNLAPNMEELIVTFFDASGTSFSVKNFTSFTIEKDQFNPADAFTLVISDNRAAEVNSLLRQGMKVKFEIQNYQSGAHIHTVMWGYIFDFRLAYITSGGTSLTIRGQDLLGYMGKCNILPNLGQSTQTNFHFATTDTIIHALQTIANAFTGQAQLPLKINIVTTPFFQNYTFQTGGAKGLRSHGKTGRGLARSLQSSFNHLTAPNKGESYLAYMVRLCKHIGCNIKMDPNTDNTICIAPPLYRPAVYYLNHSKTGTNPNTGKRNNILSGNIEINVADQPSVIIVEMATAGYNAYYKSTKKCICINEITGYKEESNTWTLLAQCIGCPVSNDNLLPNVKKAISDLTTGKQGTDYIVLPINNDLFKNLPEIALTVQTETSLPRFFVDQNAHDEDELKFGTAMAMAEAQDKYMVLEYTTDGLSQDTGWVWESNMTCHVFDDITAAESKTGYSMPMAAIDNDFYISKIQLTGNRNHYETHITLTLLYTHIFEITEG
jgi:hypothetical protein